MLTVEQNRALTEVAAATPMGELLRRYWFPIAGSSTLPAGGVRPIRLLGENLVLFRTLDGTPGLTERHCPHRRADLSRGFVERAALRCSYHGWAFAPDGACVERPYEDTTVSEGAALRNRIAVGSYPLRELAGLVWAYMGPLPAPELPVWEPFTWGNGFVEIVVTEVPCNWFQCQENSCDPVHFEWTHDNWSLYLAGERERRSARHLKVEFAEFEHGFIYKRIREGMNDTNPVWQIGRVALWPQAFYLGDHFEWRVPIDDRNTLSIGWFFTRVPPEQEPYVQGEVPVWEGPLRDARGEWIDTHVLNQDFIAWVGQGEIADRTRERLASSDKGVAMMRRRYFEEMERVARGEDPKSVLRDPQQARRVALPIAGKETYVDGLPLADWPRHGLLRQRLDGFHWQAGQPAAVWNAYAQAMGIPRSVG